MNMMTKRIQKQFQSSFLVLLMGSVVIAGCATRNMIGETDRRNIKLERENKALNDKLKALEKENKALNAQINSQNDAEDAPAETQVDVLFKDSIEADKAGDYEGAIKAYSQVIALEPNNAVAYNNRGVAKANMKRYEEAIADFDKAIELKPDFAVAYTSRGFTLWELDQGSILAAKSDFRIALRLATQQEDKSLIEDGSQKRSHSLPRRKAELKQKVSCESRGATDFERNQEAHPQDSDG
jgi:tetratricopeptide (TPR) repeat protein